MATVTPTQQQTHREEDIAIPKVLFGPLSSAAANSPFRLSNEVNTTSTSSMAPHNLQKCPIESMNVFQQSIFADTSNDLPLEPFVIHRKLLRRRHVRKLQMKKEREARKARQVAVGNRHQDSRKRSGAPSNNKSTSDIFRPKSTASTDRAPALALTASFSDLATAKSVDGNDVSGASSGRPAKRIKLVRSSSSIDNATFGNSSIGFSYNQAAMARVILPQKLPLDLSPVRVRPQRISLRPFISSSA